MYIIIIKLIEFIIESIFLLISLRVRVFVFDGEIHRLNKKEKILVDANYYFVYPEPQSPAQELRKNPGLAIC